MKRFFALAIPCVLGLGLTASAFASPITAGTYDLTNTTVLVGSTTYTFSGDVTLNGSGLVTAADITLNDAAIGSPVFNHVSSTGSGGYAPVADFAYITTATNSAQIYLSYLQTFDGSGNIDLCIAGSTCNGYQASYTQIYFASAFGYNAVDLNGGTLDPHVASVVPEPSSLAFLATGILGAAGAVRRRFIRA